MAPRSDAERSRRSSKMQTSLSVRLGLPRAATRTSSAGSWRNARRASPETVRACAMRAVSSSSIGGNVQDAFAREFGGGTRGRNAKRVEMRAGRDPRQFLIESGVEMRAVSKDAAGLRNDEGLIVEV